MLWSQSGLLTGALRARACERSSRSRRVLQPPVPFDGLMDQKVSSGARISTPAPLVQVRMRVDALAYLREATKASIRLTHRPRSWVISLEPCYGVEHLGDQLAGAVGDVVIRARNLYQRGFNSPQFQGMVELLGF